MKAAVAGLRLFAVLVLVATAWFAATTSVSAQRGSVDQRND